MKDELTTRTKERLHHMEEDPAYYWEDEAYEAYNEMLNDSGSSLKDENPLAYRCGFVNYMTGDTAKSFAKNQSEYGELEDLLEEYTDARNALEAWFICCR